MVTVTAQIVDVDSDELMAPELRQEGGAGPSMAAVLIRMTPEARERLRPLECDIITLSVERKAL
jgi:hypothetical protein